MYQTAFRDAPDRGSECGSPPDPPGACRRTRRPGTRGVVPGSIFAPGAAAQVDGTVGEMAKGRQPALKIVHLPFEHGLGIRRERIGVDRGHKDRMAGRRRRWDLRERPLPDRRPQPGFHQEVAHRLRIELGHIAAGEALERLMIGVLRFAPPFARGQVNDHRLQRSARAAIDRRHGPGARRGKPHTFRLAILEQAAGRV